MHRKSLHGYWAMAIHGGQHWGQERGHGVEKGQVGRVHMHDGGGVTSPLSLRRDLFITLDLDDFFSALTLNLAFLP